MERRGLLTVKGVRRPGLAYSCLVMTGGGPALPVEPFEPVEQDVEGELELELIVAASPDDRGVVVRDRRGQLMAVGVPGRHLVQRCGLRFAVDCRALRGR